MVQMFQREYFDNKLTDILKKDLWIIDGNYLRTLEIRLKACDTVFFLDYPLELCIESIKGRIGKPREDLPWVETGYDEEFNQEVLNFPKEQLPKIYDLLGKYIENREIVIFRSRTEASDYLRQHTEICHG